MRLKSVSESAQEPLANEVCLFCKHYRKIEQNDEITGQFRLEGSSGDHLVQPTSQSRDRPGCSKSFTNDFWKASGMKTSKPLDANSYCISLASCKEIFNLI